MLTLIFGKPGSGKSYYAVERIANSLVDFVGAELRSGAQPRRVYTNLILNFDALSKYVSDRVGERVEISDYIVPLDEEFFLGPNKSPHFEWWNQFEEGAYIVIDEVHHYLGADADRGDREYLVAWRNYISTHRHRKHDLTLITQHTDNIQRSVLCMAENAYHIINIKSLVLPFLGIPFADLDVVKEAWGIKHQYIQIYYGCYVGRVFRHESIFRELLKPEIYALYQSHTLAKAGEEVSDRPSLNLGRLGSLWWLFKRHAFQLSMKAVGVYLAVMTIILTFKALPGAMAAGVSHAMGGDSEVTVKEETKEEKPVLEKSVSSPVVQGQGGVVPVVVPDEKILVIMPSAIITDKGRRAIGDVVIKAGVPQKLVGIDVQKGICEFVPFDGAGAGADGVGVSPSTSEGTDLINRPVSDE